MTCEPNMVACQLDRLVEASAGWDWNAFVSTLVATLISAGVGVFGVWLGFRWQSKQRYREILDESIVKVLEQIASDADTLERVRQQREMVADYDRLNADYFTKTGEQPLVEPRGFALSIALNIARMRARGEDQSIVTAVIRAESETNNAPPQDRLTVLGLLAGALSEWRSGNQPARGVHGAIARAVAFAEPLDVEVDQRP